MISEKWEDSSIYFIDSRIAHLRHEFKLKNEEKKKWDRIDVV